MSQYDRELVERILPAVWDDNCAFGIDRPDAPRTVVQCRIHKRLDGTPREDCACTDPASRKATIDPKRSGTLFAHIADIRAAWKRTYLTDKERRALLMRYGLGWSQHEIGAHEGVTKQTIEERLTRGVGRLRDHLNGSDMTECVSETEGGGRQ